MAAIVSSPASSEPEATPALAAWFERWGLAIAAAGCWVFAAAGLLADLLLNAPQPVVIPLFVASYLAGGTMAAPLLSALFAMGQIPFKT